MTIDFAKVSYRSGIGGSAGETPRREVAEVARLSAMTVAERRTHDTHSFVVSSLGQRIGAGELVPSTDLTLASLEAEYGVSRTVVREAVRVLESKGMLVSRRRIGLVVQPVENWDLLDRSVIQWRLAGSWQPTSTTWTSRSSNTGSPTSGSAQTLIQWPTPTPHR